jgi:nitrite reductase (NADH) small subunit
VLVVKFAATGGDNCVVVDGCPLFYARTELGSFVMPARCRHRGGPLHLARFDPGLGVLVCPWHERLTSVHKALTAGIPAVRRGSTVTAVLSTEATARLAHEHRPTLGRRP